MSDTVTDAETTTPDRPVELDTVAAVRELRDAMRQAGLGSADLLDDGKSCAIITTDASALARFVRHGMLDTFNAASALADSLRACGLDMPAPDVDQRKINLGKVPVPVAAELAIALGVPKEKVDTGYDASRGRSFWAYAGHVGAVLREAFHESTGCALVDYLFHPDCLQCDADSHIELGRIDVVAAHRMAEALRAGKGVAACQP